MPTSPTRAPPRPSPRRPPRRPRPPAHRSPTGPRTRPTPRSPPARGSATRWCSPLPSTATPTFPDPATPTPLAGSRSSRSRSGEWCIDMEAVELASAVTDAHIHFGPAGRSGDVVIPIGAPTSTSGHRDTWTDVCVTVEERTVDEILASPESFYANIHTDTHPDGAIRGQLALSSVFELELS
ncbi:MAG: CHRD domain-containing protein [Acidimicrobiales bacterium]|nr:CHRD domain-containing protein [Acidimicrobiales bacterium]